MLTAGSNVRIATDYGPVTPSDSVMFPNEVAGIYAGGAGIVLLIKRDGRQVPFTVTAGQILPFNCIGVGASSTATLMNWFL